MAPKPRIEKLVVPRFEERQPLEVDFRFSVKGSKDALLEVALNTPLGMVRELVPATLASVEGRRGAGRLGLDLGALPPGASELTLVLVAADGTRGEPASAELEVPGGEGEAPSLLKLRVPERRITRPHDDDVVFGQLVLAAEPGDHELAAAWMRTRRPDGTEVATATAPPSAAAGAEGRVTFASFGAGDELGEYVVSLTLLDASGNQSKTLEAVVELVSRGGAQGPRIKSFAPREAAAGDEVVVRGHGLDPDHLAVEVGGMSAPILASDGAAVRILMPSVDAPGRIVATGPAGTALSGEQLVPRAQVQIVPDEIQVPEGVPLALNAVVTGTTDGSVEWKAQARSGEPGTISSEGLYTPPLGGARGAVTIKAASKSNPDAVGSARVRVVAHPPARGPLPLGPLGGTVRSHDDACALQLPKGALKKLSLIGIETTPPKLDGGAPGGQLVVGGARIDGSTGALGAPAELTLPLPFPLEVGEKVRVQFRDDRREPWKDLPDLAEVIPGEEALKIRLQSLHDYYRGIYEPGPTAPSYLPAITSLTPSALDEGDTAAVLVTGKNFVPGVTTVSVLKWPAGGTEARVETRTVYVTADGTKLGVTLKAGVMADLAEGSIRSVRLRVTTPAGSAERRLDILGHDELVVQGTVTWSQSRTFSRVTIAPGATLRVAHTAPPVTLTAMETIVVGGAAGEAAGLVEVITGSGSSGTDGEAITARGKGGAGGSTAAGLPAVPGGGGAGGDGGTGPRSGPGMPGDGSSGTPGTAPARPAGALRVSAGGGGGLASTWVGGDGVSGSPAPMGLPSALFAPEFISGSGGSGGGGRGRQCTGQPAECDHQDRWRWRGWRSGRRRVCARCRGGDPDPWTRRRERRRRRGWSLSVRRRHAALGSALPRRLRWRRRGRGGGLRVPARRAPAGRRGARGRRRRWTRRPLCRCRRHDPRHAHAASAPARKSAERSHSHRRQAFGVGDDRAGRVLRAGPRLPPQPRCGCPAGHRPGDDSRDLAGSEHKRRAVRRGFRRPVHGHGTARAWLQRDRRRRVGRPNYLRRCRSPAPPQDPPPPWRRAGPRIRMRNLAALAVGGYRALHQADSDGHRHDPDRGVVVGGRRQR